MALRYFQSFDYTTITQLGLEGVVSGASIGTGRFGSGLSINTQNDSWTWNGDGGSSEATWFMGTAFRWTSGAAACDIFQIVDNANITHAALQLDTNRKLVVTRSGGGGGTTILGPGSTVLTQSVWYYIEFKVTIADSPNGVAEVKINGVSELSSSTLDTRNAGAAASADHFRLGSWSNTTAINADWDDLYVCDGSGSAPTNTFLGDCRVQALYPSGAGNSAQLTRGGTDSGANWSQVEEATSDDDGTYVESSTVNDKDTYAYGNLTPTTGTVYGVRPILVAKKTDAGTRSVASIARLSGTEVDSANKTLSTSYQNLWDIRETKPGGGAWSISDVNSAEFGVKVTA